MRVIYDDPKVNASLEMTNKQMGRVVVCTVFVAIQRYVMGKGLCVSNKVTCRLLSSARAERISYTLLISEVFL